MTGGRLITLDGIDGVGKSTQIARLSDHLRAEGHDVVAVRDPGSTAIGTSLRKLLLDSELSMHRRTEAMLFMASRCEMVETVIRPALTAGKTVISDRFLLSTVVYQSVGGNVPTELLWELGRLANGGIEPQTTILLDLPAAESAKRMSAAPDRMESRGVEYLEQVRQAFLEQLPHSSPNTSVVDAGQSEERVAEAIRQSLRSCKSS